MLLCTYAINYICRFLKSDRSTDKLNPAYEMEFFDEEQYLSGMITVFVIDGDEADVDPKVARWAKEISEPLPLPR
jgi:hypothetical protein